MLLLNENNNREKNYSSCQEEKTTSVTTTCSNHQILISSLQSEERLIILKPNYLNITDTSFKQMLSKALGVSEYMVQCLDTSEKLNYFRYYAQLINDFYCLKYEQDLWQTYYNISMIVNIWSSSSVVIIEEMALKNNPNGSLFTTHINVEKRQNIISDQLKKIQYDIIEHQQQQIDNLSIHEKFFFSQVTSSLIGDQLQQLRSEYEWRKVLFQYDANDYRLIKLFYDLKPTKDQISSTKLIWDMTIDQLKVEEQMTMTSEFFQTSHQFDSNSIPCSIEKVKEIVEHYKNTINNEKKKLFLNANPIIAIRLMDTITIRENNIRERAQHLLKHPLMSSSKTIV